MILIFMFCSYCYIVFVIYVYVPSHWTEVAMAVANYEGDGFTGEPCLSQSLLTEPP